MTYMDTHTLASVPDSKDAALPPDAPRVTGMGAGDDAGLYQPSGLYQGPDWRTRVVGVGGTTSIIIAILCMLFLTWSVVVPMIQPAEPLVVTLAPLATPTEEVREVPDGPPQVQQQEQQRPQEEVRDLPPPPPMPAARTVHVPLPTEPSPAAADPVPETTAPPAQPAPPAPRMSSTTQASWQGQLLAHLERFRRYPAVARARREQGVAQVRFTMNRQGRVLSASIARSSGSPTLDRAALDTLTRAQPLPHIPDDMNDPLTITVPVEFFVR